MHIMGLGLRMNSTCTCYQKYLQAQSERASSGLCRLSAQHMAVFRDHPQVVKCVASMGQSGVTGSVKAVQGVSASSGTHHIVHV